MRPHSIKEADVSFRPAVYPLDALSQRHVLLLLRPLGLHIEREWPLNNQKRARIVLQQFQNPICLSQVPEVALDRQQKQTVAKQSERLLRAT